MLSPPPHAYPCHHLPQLEIATESAGIKVLRRLVSPVYFSTAQDGSVHHGLDMVPTGQRPILLVGNHQVTQGGGAPAAGEGEGSKMSYLVNSQGH